MGMFDYYRPSTPLTCPVCGQVFSELQGKDGPCGLFVWEQGKAAPIDQRAGECGVPAEHRSTFRLPPEFTIYEWDEACGRMVVAYGHCTEGVWSSTELETDLNAKIQTFESLAEFGARVAELKKWRLKRR